ncbi:hypothetical protein V6N13_077847 [Hibiscus sabdariffa]
MLGLLTWTVRTKSASTWGRLNLKELSLIETRWKVGSFGLALRIAATAVADAAPTNAEVQLHFPFLPILLVGSYEDNLILRFAESSENGAETGGWWKADSEL